MDDTECVHSLPLLQGVLRWCDQDLVAKIIETERSFFFVALEGGNWPQISAEKNRSLSDYGLRDRQSGLRNAREAYWCALERDLRHRIADERLHLEGVLVTAEMDQAAQAIRGAFASEFGFNFHENTVRFKGRRYVNVTLSQTPSPWAPFEIGSAAPTRILTAINAEDLTTDQIVGVIEEHARRVIQDPEAKLMPPGKVSLIPLVRMKMQDRARRSELQSTLNGEAAWLAAWIAGKAEHWDTPKAKTIARSLGATYAMLKARSNAGI